jgi:hypothetical protein
MTRAVVMSLVVAAALLLSGAAGGSDAPSVEAPSGTLVFVSGTNRLTAIDVASGRRTVRRVASVASCAAEVYVSGGRVIFGGMRKGRTIVFSAPLSLDAPPMRLGGAHAYVPSATDGRVWLAGVDCSRPRMTGVREVTVDGRVTVESGRRVPGSWLAGAVPGGLVIQRRRTLLVWDPSTDRTVRRLDVDAVTEVHGNRLVGCDARCRSLLIVNAETGERVAVRRSGRHRLELGAEFAPDGSVLAAPAYRNRRWSVALVDPRDGTSTILPGSRTGRAYPELSWAATGWLFIRAGARRMMAYRQGTPRAVTLPFRAPREAIAFTAG